jgi:diadenosine tetraphosphate (Ap4A) HIT family hydrolase
MRIERINDAGDWADEEAARLSNLDRDTREESQWVCDQIASALRSAFQRGKVEGMREAASAVESLPDTIMHIYSRGPTSPPGNQMRPTTLNDAAAFIRATALEQENKD